MSTERHAPKRNDLGVTLALAGVAFSIFGLGYVMVATVVDFDLFLPQNVSFAGIGLAASGIASVIAAVLGNLLFSRRRHSGGQVVLLGSNSDSDEIRILKSTLTDSGLKLETAETAVLVGENFADKIERVISAADAIVLVISHETLNSEFFQNELTRARELNKRIYPVVIDDATLPSHLVGVRYADLRHDARNEALFLVKSIKEHARIARTATA